MVRGEGHDSAHTKAYSIKNAVGESQKKIERYYLCLQIFLKKSCKNINFLKQ